MFDNEIEGWGENLVSGFLDRFFPVNIQKQNNLLTIDDRRCFEIIVWAICWLVTAIFLFTFLLLPYIETVGIMFLLVIAAVLFFLSIKILQSPYRRIYTFDKTQNIYKVAKVGVLKNELSAGRLEEIKEVRINITEYENEENGDKSYSYRTFLILDHALSFGDSHLLPVEEDSRLNTRYKTSSKIAFAIAGFLDLPIPEDHQIN